MTQRALGWVLTLAAVAGVVGAGLWVSQGESAVAAALLVGGLGLFLVRAQLYCGSVRCYQRLPKYDIRAERYL